MLKRNDTAPFDLLSWLEGRTLAEGVFEDRGGRVRRRFTVELNGTAEANALRLNERFIFDNGERQERTWVLTRGPDRSFIGRLSESAGNQQVVRATIDLAHSMGKQVVAEGVENLPTAQTLTALGCDELQGYCFSRPLAVPEFQDWIRNHGVPPQRRRGTNEKL